MTVHHESAVCHDNAADHVVALRVKVGTKVFVVECIALDERIWQSRLEARGAQKGQSCSRHKPQTWDDLQALLTRWDLAMHRG